MLVNTIAFYPRPLRVVDTRGVGQRQRIRRTRRPSRPVAAAFRRRQRAEFRSGAGPDYAPVSPAAAPVECAELWLQPDPAARAALTWARPTVNNASAFGAHKFKKKLLHTAFANVSAFGAHTIAAAEKKFSYSNTLGTGNRTGSITVTLGGVTAGAGTASQLVNGSVVERVLVEQRQRRHSHVRPSAPRRSSSRRAGNRATRRRTAPSSGRARTTVRPTATSAGRSRSVARPSRSIRASSITRLPIATTA